MPDTDAIREQVIQKLLEASDLEIEASQVTPETSLRDDLELSSLQAVTLVMDLEDQFGIEVEDEELESLQTVGDILQLLETKTSQGGQ
ncbi:MAG: acyl carrier protein [Thermoanaerobaculia bacterium]